MARLRKVHKEATRRHILQAAEELFFDDGFEETKTSQIAKKAGVAEGTLYNYFPSKSAILINIIASKIYDETLVFVPDPCEYVSNEAAGIIMDRTNNFWGWASNIKRSFLRRIFIEFFKAPALHDSCSGALINFDEEFIEILKSTLANIKATPEQELNDQTSILLSVVMLSLQHYAIKDDVSADMIWRIISSKIEYLIESWGY